ncbi:extracellular solute-binding protein family 1 [Petrotoga mobilis SJ95]|jgi:ABC-type glycerol-3-phosphate transport system substrate-binding protein|uniref:Extracellular solute-binding protein family 1 n=1 Tax=Petrotoga mobilis (strain DSM 10674 / SJ95) TaxID=403833 RepID=A9BEP8_PETMO|nr:MULTISPECIES: ABC transporter substrate-binding protein [Petrotoga]ABX30776.1 extracellular solute-binding protein family 1 [Petrotoga mobilis SJ95]MBL5981315.1 ABC transporter substrate-binding protein [Petrotoga sp. 8T1HF07.NaAc.6.1]PNR89246.1 ABC transporter substrate-binding protein [Petrotoga sp. 9T1HF07.CasAA.8.2]RLL83239.1 ABC transporter substrate-binding protein [Petrotoga sp. Shatin.DS.tank11.9.2.9.3]RLL90584.1 ABC transporter substrate-binding protein [Petrotoga sp. HKA.pet.4.5]
MKKVVVLFAILTMVLSAFSITITMTAGAVGRELEVLNEQVEMFMKENPDITVNVLPMPNSSTDRHDLYVTYLASGTPDPDVLMLDVIWPAEFSPFLVDLTDDYDYFGLDGFFPGTVASNTVDGSLVAVPWFTDAGILYYRKDLLEKYGYDVPETWDELYTIAKDISQKEGIEGFVWQGARYEGLTCDVMEFVHSFGGEIMKDGEVVVDDPEYYDNNVAAITFMDKLIEDGVSPRGVTTYMEEEARRIFQNGDAVFMRNWPYAWSLVNAPESPVAGKVGITVLPKGPEPDGRNSATLGGWNLGINANSSAAEVEASKKLIKFLLSKEQQVYKAVYSGQTPTMIEAYNDPRTIEANPFYADLLDVFLNAEPRPISPIYAEISYEIQVAVHEVLTQQAEPEDALNNLAENLKSIVE